MRLFTGKDLVKLEKRKKQHLVRCLCPGDYQVSLSFGKTYSAVEYYDNPDISDFLKVIDDTGEEYLYPKALFEKV